MAPGVVYVKVNVDFTEDGFLIPRSLEWGHRIAIDRVVEAKYLSEEECQRIFTGPPRLGRYAVYQYEVEMNGQRKNLYFDRWAESGCESIGRWFVIMQGEGNDEGK